MRDQSLHAYQTRYWLHLAPGEGSYGQLVRRYGADGAADVVRRLRCVWISHIHADHHAGLPRLLALRQRILGDAAPPLPVRVAASFAHIKAFDLCHRSEITDQSSVCCCC